MSNTPRRGEMIPELPTTMELAQLAAILSQGRNASDSNQLVRDAFMLWQVCQKHLVFTIEAAGKQSRCASELAEAIAQIPKPKKFPATFEESLRAIMPKTKSKADRLKTYRDYLRESLRESLWHEKHGLTSTPPDDAPLPSIADVSESISRHKRDGFTEPGYEMAMGFFHSWLSRRQSRIASRNANARWKNKESKKGD